MHTLRIREVVLIVSLFVLLVLVYIVPNKSVVNFLTKTPSIINEYYVQKDELSKLPSFQVSGKKIVPTWDKTMNEPVWKSDLGEVVGVLEKELKQPMRVSTKGKLTILTDLSFDKYFDINTANENSIDVVISRLAELINAPVNSYDSLVLVYTTKEHMDEIRDDYETLILHNNFMFSTGSVEDQQILQARLYDDSGRSYKIIGTVNNIPRTIRIVVAGNGEMFSYPEDFLWSSLLGSLPAKDVGKKIISDEKLYMSAKEVTVTVK